MNDTAQWIVLMGFIVSFSLFFLAVLLNQSTVVGQTTAEAVSEFPKDDIRGEECDYRVCISDRCSKLQQQDEREGRYRNLALARRMPW